MSLVSLQVLVFSGSKDETRRQDLTLRALLALDRIGTELDGALLESVSLDHHSIQYRPLELDGASAPLLTPLGGFVYKPTRKLTLTETWVTTTPQPAGKPIRLAGLVTPESSLTFVRTPGSLDGLNVEVVAFDGGQSWKVMRSFSMRGQR
ncbi:hypothetical protein JST97_23350 [bacterium]|nr:hypothetical protein [bacterium]